MDIYRTDDTLNYQGNNLLFSNPVSEYLKKKATITLPGQYNFIWHQSQHHKPIIQWENYKGRRAWMIVDTFHVNNATSLLTL